MVDAELEADLRRLSESYRRKLPELLRTLEERVRDAREREGAPELREAARQLAHKLKGTSGCHGLHGPSAALERVEELLAGGRPAAWAEIERELARVRATLA